MAISLFNPSPFVALAPIMNLAEAPLVSAAAFSPVIGELRERLDTPGALGLYPAEIARVRTALMGLEQEVSRYSAAGETIAKELLQPSLDSLARSWPARLNYHGNAEDDISRDYCLGPEVAHGGCSRVYFGSYSGSEENHGHFVAIKMVDVSANPDMPVELAEKALRDEYALLSSLEPGTGPRVYRLGTLQGTLCMVMEFLNAKDLSDLWDNFHHGLRTSQDFDRLMDVARQAVCSIAMIHRQGIVHNDIKPENLKSDNGRVRIFDFGIALREGETHTVISGTPDYMPPESFAEGNRASFQRDVFALGSTLYWLVTGQKPFDADSIEETVRRVRDSDFRPEAPSAILLRNRPELKNQLSPALLCLLDAIIMRALHRNVAVRYRDAEQMLYALQNVVSPNRPAVSRGIPPNLVPVAPRRRQEPSRTPTRNERLPVSRASRREGTTG